MQHILYTPKTSVRTVRPSPRNCPPTFEQRATHRHHHQRRHVRSSFGSTETKQVPWWRRTSPSSTGAKTINVFRACLSAQLTICAQKCRNFVLFSTVSLRFVLSRVCVLFFFIVLAPGRTKERDGNTTELRMIFTCSLHKGQIPPSWKEAHVTPIYKKGKRHIPGNYRPVSLTSMAGKCTEWPIRDAIMTDMTENDLLSPKQHGFIQGRSCVTQLLAALVLDSRTLALNEGETSTPVNLTSHSLLKVFDTVPHQRMLTKLRGYSIAGRILTWIEAFLTDRKQKVMVNDSRSSSMGRCHEWNSPGQRPRARCF